MASEQLNRRDNTRKEREIQVEKERVPQLTSHFEAIAVHGNRPTTDSSIAKGALPGREEERHRIGGGGEKPDELAAQFESLADRVRDMKETDTEKERERQEQRAAAHERQQKGSQTGGKQRISEEGEAASRQNQPSLEEIANYRATAQEKSNEAIKAARDRYEKENKESLDLNKTEETKQRGTEQEAEEGTFEGRGQQTGLGTVKETLTSAAKTAKDYTAPIAEKAKDYTVSAGQTTANYIGEKAVAAKDVAVESGKVAAEYAGKAAEDLKDKAVVAGWSTAHYSCDTAVEGTKAAARLVKGAAEYAGSIAAQPLSAAKNVAESTGESVKDYTARKKEEAQRESMKKQGEKESMYEKTKETFEGAKEGVKERGGEEKSVDSGILGAIGEAIYDIAQTTKEIMIGSDDGTGKQTTLGFDLGQDEGEEKGQGYEKKEHYQTTTTTTKKGA